MKHILALLVIALTSLFAFGQIPTSTLVQIVKAEDSRAYGQGLENLMRSPNADVRKRAVLAAGRIGDDEAITTLTMLLENDRSPDVRSMAAFAIGEVESVKGTDAILKVLSDTRGPNEIRARAVEAAGKIAAANAKDEKAKALGSAIVEVLNFENGKRSAPFADVVRFGLTAALRARPEGAADAVKNFLRYSDPHVVADALNTLTRLRAKNANTEARSLLDHTDPIVRANAARVLGAAEDKDASEMLLNVAIGDPDSRVRVSAIRSLVTLKYTNAGAKLAARGNELLLPIHGDPAPIKPGKLAGPLKPIEVPLPKSELLEIISALGRLLPNSDDPAAVALITKFRVADRFHSPEASVALIRVSQSSFEKQQKENGSLIARDWRALSATAQAIADPSNTEVNESRKATREKDISVLRTLLDSVFDKSINQGLATGEMSKALPELMQAYAAFKPADAGETIIRFLLVDDVIIRATAAGMIADMPATSKNFDALKKAFTFSLLHDKRYNDAQLAILDALYKLDKKAAVGTFLVALNAPDHLVRKKAFELLADKELQKQFPGVSVSLAAARSKHKDQVLPYAPALGTRLGQVLNAEADYRRAVSRKKGSVRAVLTTDNGTFTIVFDPEEAPLTVDNWVKLARSGYFNGLEVHRVVPNFVMQDGDPRGDGNGGPGWSIRCEVNMLPYDRGAVGMALSGKDTGGSQWFVTHAPQPHLDGGYTVFGHVDEAGMAVVDQIARGDRIISVKIVGR